MCSCFLCFLFQVQCNLLAINCAIKQSQLYESMLLLYARFFFLISHFSFMIYATSLLLLHSCSIIIIMMMYFALHASHEQLRVHVMLSFPFATRIAAFLFLSF